MGKHSLLLLAAAAAVTGPSAAAEPLQQGLAVGEAFPTLAFASLEDGSTRSLADYRGRKLLLHVFASW